MPTTVDIESQRMLLGTTPVRKLYHGANLIGTRIAELFANGEQGVWFDPSDISTLYQDAAGTIPVTGVEQPVGRMLDKSGRGNHASQATTTARPILRARYNLLTATEFAGGLANASASGGNVSAVAFPGFAGGVAFTGNSVTSYAYQSPGVLPTGAGVIFSCYIIMDDGEAPAVSQSSSSGDFSVAIETSTAGVSVRVERIAGALYRVIATKPITTGGSSNSGIVKYTGQSSRSFRVTGYDLRYTSGTALPPYQRVTSNTDYDTTGFPYYLKPDGVDDWMVTGNIDLSSTSNMSIVAGAEKLNELAPFYQALAELGPGNVEGSFAFWHPYSDTQHSRVIARGAGASSQTVFASDIPGNRTDVLTSTVEFGAFRIRYKVSGTQYPNYAGNADPGKFGNLPLYLFSRAGTSSRFRGGFYGLIMVGRLLSNGELASAHEFMRNKSRAY